MTPEEALKVKSLTDPSDIFNYVVDHLRKQGCRSLQALQEGELGGCSYRGDGGTMCAIGTLMTDDEYDHTWEGVGVYHLIIGECLPPALEKRLGPNCRMLMDLQQFHDDYLEYLDGAFAETSETHINDLREKWGIK
jgi:hypothetical protein